MIDYVERSRHIESLARGVAEDKSDKVVPAETGKVARPEPEDGFTDEFEERRQKVAKLPIQQGTDTLNSDRGICQKPLASSECVIKGEAEPPPRSNDHYSKQGDDGEEQESEFPYVTREARYDDAEEDEDTFHWRTIETDDENEGRLWRTIGTEKFDGGEAHVYRSANSACL
jgi:hypothetical protein